MNSRWKRTTFLAILLLLTAFVYRSVLEHEFLPYDDDRYITANAPVQRGLTWETVVWAFTSSHASNWHPLTWISHMADVEMFGLDPRGHHLVNLILHLLNTLFLYLAFHRLTGAFWQSLFVAALFALHPLHVESVAWAAERKDVLSTLFFAAALWAYAHYAAQPNKARFASVVLCMLLGVLSKPMLVTFPFVLLLLDYWPLMRIGSAQPELIGTWDQPAPNRWRKNSSLWGALVWEKFWLFVISVAVSNITLRVQGYGGAVSTVEATPVSMRFTNAAVAYVTYLRKMFWPRDLAVFYPHAAENIGQAAVIASLILLAGVTVLVIVAWRHRFLAVGWFWFLGTLVPVIGLVQVGAQALADRYTYIPLIGIFVMMAWGLDLLLQQMRVKKFVLGTFGLAAVAVCAILTQEQVVIWKDGITLFERALAVTEKNWVAHHNLAWELHRRGRLEEAESHYKEALRLQPGIAVAHYNLGRLYLDQGREAEASASFDTALVIDPTLQFAILAKGKLIERSEGGLEAIRYYRQTLERYPDLDEVHYALALLLIEEHAEGEAVYHLQRVLELNQFHSEARQRLGEITGEDL